MTIRVRTPRAAGVVVLLLAAGCQQPSERVVANLPDPLIGGRELRPMPPETPRIEPPLGKPLPLGAEFGWLPPRGVSNRWQCIVIHHSAKDTDTPEGMAAWHVQRGWDELGYHFVIGNGVRYPDGQVFVGPRWTKQKHGAHCKVPSNYYNEHGIGICLIGNLNYHGPTARQMESLERLVRFLMRQCSVPVTRIYTHGGITHKTECPGSHFSLATIRQRVARQSISASSN